jgi:hypothetical protein
LFADSFWAQNSAGTLVGYFSPTGFSIEEPGGGFSVTITTANLTANRGIFFPDKPGTLAVTTDIPATPEVPVKAWVTFDGTTATATANVTGTYTRVGTIITITVTGHGHSVGHKVAALFTSGGATSALYDVATVVDANNFTITAPAAGGPGNVTLLRKPIKQSSGIQSVTYSNTAGIFYANFSTAFSSVNYAAPTGSSRNAGTGGFCFPGYTSAGKTTMYCILFTSLITAITTAVSVEDATQIFVGTQ